MTKLRKYDCLGNPTLMEVFNEQQRKRKERRAAKTPQRETIERQKFNRFGKGFAGMKGGTFKCSQCGEMTRDTGDNAGVGLCPICYEEDELENSFADEQITREEYDKKMQKIDEKREKREARKFKKLVGVMKT